MKHVLTTLMLCFVTVMAFAQKAPTEVSLVVSADGPTKTEAVNNALRSAIEQSFGTFVSANTEILNDDLVKDEIATVSSGNIQNYSEVASVSLPNGNTSVTLNVTVSLSKLVSYAQSKGSQCEFAGATFGANRRLYEFNKKNEQIAIQNMIKQLDALRPVYDYEIEVSDPKMDEDGRNATIEIKVMAKANEKSKMFNDIIEKTIMSLAMTKEQIKPMTDAGFKYERYYVAIGANKDYLYSCLKRCSQAYYENNLKGKEFFFYNPVPEDVSLFCLESFCDFLIKDNLGGDYSVEFKMNSSNSFGHIYKSIGNDRDAFYNASLEQFWVVRNNFTGYIIVNTSDIQGSTPSLSYKIPITYLEKINKISIESIKQTNKDGCGGDPIKTSFTVSSEQLHNIYQISPEDDPDFKNAVREEHNRIMDAIKSIDKACEKNELKYNPHVWYYKCKIYCSLIASYKNYNYGKIKRASIPDDYYKEAKAAAKKCEELDKDGKYTEMVKKLIEEMEKEPQYDSDMMDESVW